MSKIVVDRIKAFARPEIEPEQNIEPELPAQQVYVLRGEAVESILRHLKDLTDIQERISNLELEVCSLGFRSVGRPEGARLILLV